MNEFVQFLPPDRPDDYAQWRADVEQIQAQRELELIRRSETRLFGWLLVLVVVGALVFERWAGDLGLLLDFQTIEAATAVVQLLAFVGVALGVGLELANVRQRRVAVVRKADLAAKLHTLEIASKVTDAARVDDDATTADSAWA